MTEPTQKRYRTADETLGGIRRQINALPAYAAETGEIGLAEFEDLRKIVLAAQGQLAAKLVVEQGWSWGQVGRELGMTRQSARERWDKDVTAYKARSEAMPTADLVADRAE
jgi:hypothetical protein